MQIALAIAGAFVATPGRAAPNAVEVADPVYAALGDAEFAQADDASAALLAQTFSSPRDEAVALRARIELLSQRHRLLQQPGNELALRIASFMARHPEQPNLRQLLELYRSADDLTSSDGVTIPDDARRALPAGETAYLDVSGAYRASDMQRIVTLAPRAIDAWSADTTAHARWHAHDLAMMLARAQGRLGLLDDALASYARAARFAEQAFGADSGLRLEADSGTAETLEEQGRLREEQQLREAIVERARRRFGAERIQTAEAEGGLGACLQTLGDYAAARVHYEAAEAVLNRLPHPRAQTRVMIANNFANLLVDIGEYPAALERYRVAIEANAGNPFARHHLALITNNLADAESVLGRLDESEGHALQARALCDLVDGKDSLCSASALGVLGTVALLRHDYASAERHLGAAAAIDERLLPADHPNRIGHVFGLALARWGAGDLAGASALARSAAERSQSLLHAIGAGYSEHQSLALRAKLPPATALAVTLAAARGDPADVREAWRLAMIDRGLLARVKATELAAAHLSRDPALASAIGAWREASARLLSALVDTNRQSGRIAAAQSDVEHAERAVWARTERAQPPPAAATEAPDLDALAHALPSGGTLAAVAEALPDDPAWAAVGTARRGPTRWFAFVLDPRGAPALQPLGRIGAIEEAVRAWYTDLQDPESDRDALRRHGAAVGASLLDPLQLAPGPHDLFVIPAGELYRVDLAALPRGAGYAIESGLRFHTLGHERDLLAAPAQAPGGMRVLLAGAPAFATDPAASSGGACPVTANPPPLQHAQRELDDVRRVLGGAGYSVAALSGERASKPRVAAAIPGAGIVHLATHGFALDGAGCAERADQRSVRLRVRAGADADAAAAVAGLAFLAGPRGGAADGLLGAGELASMDFSHAAWVALSACDSGLGPIASGEGVFGMRRALRLAGAGTVIMSLWRVDDAATVDLMAALYRARFVERRSVPDAMAAAMQSVLAQRRAAGLSDHPYYWAAFVSEGTWR